MSFSVCCGLGGCCRFMNGTSLSLWAPSSLGLGEEMREETVKFCPNDDASWMVFSCT